MFPRTPPTMSISTIADDQWNLVAIELLSDD
jgi:hypothetical protein